MTWSDRLIHDVLHAAERVAPKVAPRLALQGFITPIPARKVSIAPVPGAVQLEARSGGLRLRLQSWGQGPKVLLTHGWKDRGDHHQALVKPLRAKGFQVLALDGPAHGRSQGLRVDPFQYGIAIGDVLKQHGPFAGLISHSFSGLSALYYLSVHPEVHVPRMVTLGCPAELNGILERYSRRLSLPDGLVERMKPLLSERMDGVSTSEISAPGSAGRLTRTKGLVVHDAGDPITPFANAEAIAAAWPGALLYRTEKLGHNRTFLDPGVTLAISQFLAGESLRREGEKKDAHQQQKNSGPLGSAQAFIQE